MRAASSAIMASGVLPVVRGSGLMSSNSSGNSRGMRLA
jgi:hypothetical protein